MAIGADIVRKLTVDYTATGADDAAAKGRAVADAYLSAGRAADVAAKSTGGLETATSKFTDQLQRNISAMRQSEQVTRAMGVANAAALDAVQVGSRLTATTIAGSVTGAVNQIATVAPYAAKVLTSTVAPALTIVAAEGAKAALVMGQELLPALGAIGKELFTALGPLGGVLLMIYLVVKAITYLASTVVESVKAFEAFQDWQTTLQSNLKLTGAAVGLTADQIEALVEKVGDIKNTREAADALVKLGTVSGDTFGRVLGLARDLSAEGFGSVSESAKALAKVLSEPEEGFKALDKVGVHASATFRAFLQDLVNTGQGAKAGGLALDFLQQKIGGASSGRDDTLTGAMAALSDSLTIGREKFGAWIVGVTNLIGLIQTLTGVMNNLNGVTKNGVTAAAELTAEQKAVQDAAAAAAARLSARYRRPGSNVTLVPSDTATVAQDAAASGAEQASIQAENALRQKQGERIDDVRNAIQKEIDVLQKTALQKAIDAELTKAQVAADSDAAAGIIELVKRREQLKNQGSDDYLERFNSALKSLAGSAGDAGKAITQQFKLDDLKKELEKAQKALSDSGVVDFTKWKAASEQYKAAVKAVMEPADTKDTASRWDTVTASIERQTVRITADTLAVGQSAAGQETLRAEFALLQAAKEADLGVTDDQIAKYTQYRASMTATQALTAAGIKLDDDQVVAFKRVTEGAGEAAKARALAKASDDAAFNLQTTFFSSTEKQVADLERSLHGDMWQKFMNDGLAAQTRLAAAFKELNSAAGTFASGFIKDIDNGVEPMQALASACVNLVASLIAQTPDGKPAGPVEPAHESSNVVAFCKYKKPAKVAA